MGWEQDLASMRFYILSSALSSCVVGDLERKISFLDSTGLLGSHKEGKCVSNFMKWQKVNLSVVSNVSMLAHISEDGWIQSADAGSNRAGLYSDFKS